MPEPPSHNNFRPPLPSGQLPQRPNQPLHGQQSPEVGQPHTGAGTINNHHTGTLQQGMPSPSPFQTKPLFGGAPQPQAWNNGPAPSQNPAWNNGSAPSQPPAWNNGSAPGQPPAWNNGSALGQPPAWNNGSALGQPPAWNNGSAPNQNPAWNNSSAPGQPPAWNNGSAPGQNPAWNNGAAQRPPYPPQTPPISPNQHWGPPWAAAAHTKKSGLIQRVQNRYQRLSKSGKIISLVLVVAILLPSFFGLFEVINGVILYNQVRSGMAHLQAAQALFSGGASGDQAKYFDPAKLQQAQIEIAAAHDDFSALSDKLDHDSSMGFAGALLPSQIKAARSLAHIAVDATTIGEKLLPTVIKFAPSIASNLRASAADKDTAHPKPYLTKETFSALNQDLDTLMPVFQDMSNYAQGVNINGLPLSASQQKMISSLLPLLPTVYTLLAQGPGLREALSWLIGVDQQRTFLLEPMDSAELRSTGGFNGQFGELTFNGGHMAKLQMKNIGAYEEDHSGLPGGTGPLIQELFNKVTTQTAPYPYNAWWPVANFGVRDANVSADFPTTAKIIMQYYTGEFGTPLSGVILFTPTLIKQILHVIGSIKIPEYGETITEQNLEAKLHYYQLDNKGIRREQDIERIPDAELARKAFTQHVTQTLMATVMHLPVAQLVPMGAQMLQAMKTKDLQVYMDNPQIKDLITKYGSTASMDRSNAHDGLYVVQENLSASKASQYVSTSIKDTVTLNAQKDATHSLTMVLDYQKKGDVYGPDTYHDYVRVYVPENSTLLSGNGFAQANQGALCGLPSDGYLACQQDVYTDSSLVCSSLTVGVDRPTGYIAGLGPKGAYLNPIGAPPNQTSDEPGRAMFGGWVVIPPDCKMTVTLSWTVPATGQNDYSLLFQPQASVNPQVDLTVKSTACSSKDAQFSGTLNGLDTLFSLKSQGTSCSLQQK